MEEEALYRRVEDIDENPRAGSSRAALQRRQPMPLPKAHPLAARKPHVKPKSAPARPRNPGRPFRKPAGRPGQNKRPINDQPVDREKQWLYGGPKNEKEIWH